MLDELNVNVRELNDKLAIRNPISPRVTMAKERSRTGLCSWLIFVVVPRDGDRGLSLAELRSSFIITVICV